MNEFFDFTVLIALASILALIANRFRQPLILGYIGAGVLIKVFGIIDPNDITEFKIFSEIGIVFLLFILGLDLDIANLGNLGITAFVTGIGQIVFTVLVGFFIALLLGYQATSSLVIAVALTFSSTIVIVKLLSSRNDLDSLYGKISISFLLVQDLAAIIILILLSAAFQDGNSDQIYLKLAELGIVLLILGIVLYVINKYIAPALIHFTLYDREVLFISMVSLALIFALGMSQLGLSKEIGALAAGIALSTRKEALQIESWTKPLRDFFIPIFFVLLGFSIDVSDVSSVIIESIVFSLFILIGNPFIVMVIMRLLKFDTIVGFQCGLTVAQISEFSLIVAEFVRNNDSSIISSSDLTMLTIVGGITMSVSSYMILYSEEVYSFIRPLLKKTFLYIEEDYDVDSYSKQRLSNKIIVFGFNRMARSLIPLIKRQKHKFVIVDNDPEKLEFAEKFGAKTIYGDLKDESLLNGLKLEKAEMIISTVPDINANLNLLYELQNLTRKPVVIVTALNDEDASKLYEEGASYVVYPYILASNFLHRVITNKDTIRSLKRAAQKDQEYISQRNNLHLVKK
ncbi:MAG: potassium efflux system protein [Candidatus Dojkabacteria bacterium]|nr:MAG: potassium efflux system protein [Candidatus Dojkabacteria bacterium]